MSEALDAILESGLTQMGIELGSEARNRQLEFVDLLARWNRVYNLSAVRRPREMVARHILDSLSLLGHLRGPRVLDAGTGAGLPGIPLALARPDLEFVLADGSGKRIRFVRHVVRQLGLENVEPVQARLEDLSLDRPPDDIVARALAPLPRLVELVAPWLHGTARLLAMKGRLETGEIEGLGSEYVARTVWLDPPGQTGQRSLVIVTHQQPG